MKDVNLVESIFSKNLQFESALLCTYGLNLNFFEKYLMQLEALYSCDQISIVTDSSTYDSFIKESYTPRWLNKKYLVNRLRANHIFHSKLYMFASERKALIAIGSGNLTREGIASNLELLSTFEISEKDRSYSVLLQDCIEYVRRLAEIIKSKNAVAHIDFFSHLCQPYLGNASNGDVRFIHNLDKPIIESIHEYTSAYRISKIQVLSPFYDPNLQAFREFRKLFPGCSFEIYFQQKKSNFPRELFDELKDQVALMLYKNVERYLHGKVILLHADDNIILFIGSANFTYHGLLTRAVDGNYEIGLIGSIDEGIVENILCPAGKNAKRVKKVDEIEVTSASKYEPQSGFVDYIIEAVLKENCINVEINHEIDHREFTADKFRILDFNDNIYEENIGREFTLKLSSEIRKQFTGRIAVQIIGHDSQNNIRESNIAWVIELEGKDRDPLRRRLRRIYNDPFQLISVLQEIVETGDEEELRRFLSTFDIPLDLVLPPRNYQGSGILQSKGNIEGTLPKHHDSIFSAKILDAFVDCLGRLQHKLERHAENPQANKINNFIMIISSMYSLIWFISNEVVYERYRHLSVITPDDWALVRDYYDMLLKFIKCSWELVWSKGGYRDLINAKISVDIAHEYDSEKTTFEVYLKEDYSDTFEELISIALKTLKMFGDLKETLRVRTGYGKEITPNIFPNTHMYLQPQQVKCIKDSIDAVRNMMTSESRNIREGVPLAALINNYSEGKGGERLRRLKAIIESFPATVHTFLYNDIPVGKLKAGEFDCLILSGSDLNVSDLTDRRKMDAEINQLKKIEIPVLAVCFGLHLAVHAYGARIERNDNSGEFCLPNGKEILIEINHDPENLISSPKAHVNVNHRDYVSPGDPQLLKSFQVRSISIDKGKAYLQYAKHKQKAIFCVQFHPESFDSATPIVKDTGSKIIHNFLNIVLKTIREKPECYKSRQPRGRSFEENGDTYHFSKS